jgi:hypothetical protein
MSQRGRRQLRTLIVAPAAVVLALAVAWLRD